MVLLALGHNNINVEKTIRVFTTEKVPKQILERFPKDTFVSQSTVKCLTVGSRLTRFFFLKKKNECMKAFLFVGLEKHL